MARTRKPGRVQRIYIVGSAVDIGGGGADAGTDNDYLNAPPQPVYIAGSDIDLAGAGGGGGPIDDPLTIGVVNITDHIGIASDAAPATGTFDGGGDANAAMTFTAVTPGVAGNDLVVYAYSDAPTEPLSVVYDEPEIAISLETLGDSVSVSTASQIIDLINADPVVSLLVVASLAPGSDGSGVVPSGSMSYLELAGGAAASSTNISGGFAADGQFLKVTAGEVDGVAIQVADVNDLTGELAGKATAVSVSDLTAVVDALALVVATKKAAYLFHYDFAVSGGVQGVINLVGETTIPDNFVATHSWFDVLTPLAGGAGSLAALGVQVSGDLVNTTAVTGAPWSTEGPKVTLIDPTVAGLKMTATRTPILFVSVNDLTAGVFDLWIEGMQGQ